MMLLLLCSRMKEAILKAMLSPVSSLPYRKTLVGDGFASCLHELSHKLLSPAAQAPPPDLVMSVRVVIMSHILHSPPLLVACPGLAT